jgi:hypothetical protein
MNLCRLAAALLLLAAPLAAEAQQPTKVYRLGYLSEGTPAAPAPKRRRSNRQRESLP